MNSQPRSARRDRREVGSRTFRISRVKRGTEPLLQIAGSVAVERLVDRGAIESCSLHKERLVETPRIHPVVCAAHHAFGRHLPLCLSPDMIWLLICQAVANHINAHSEELRPLFVRHAGKVDLHVQRDDFVKGSPDNAWPEVFDEFSSRIREHVGPAIDLFLPAFSTTGPVERAVGEVILLDAVRSYFSYSTGSLCGIPIITLEGTTEDWESLARRADEFARFGLAHWLGLLKPIFDQFVRASEGEVDAGFWRSLYKAYHMSGGPVVNGWITAFFPYLRDSRTGRATGPMHALLGESAATPEFLYPGSRRTQNFPGLQLGHFPGGLSKTPFVWHYLNNSYEMEFFGGFIGVSQNEQTLALRPEIGWVVKEELTAAEPRPYTYIPDQSHFR